ncbi:lipopolysaccharide export system protein LptC [Acinetobacter marinus]|uniref:Lipopolysaccharide export system protein LptC n=1 Tax=Acinetobacter marinus TaxID=281375 RepID=A0A1G6IHZ6_9GAMM|nr:LPS export ABC transporter periplasmic protein LptC [Acinetobacter marinus]SDC05645.1 lipopolysaccharide export system protein LptC [Acinetobacter marinus]
MDTRLLYSIAMVFVIIVAGFYYFSGKSKRLEASKDANLNSTAKTIQVTQTNEQGQLYAKSTIQGMTVNMQSGDAVLEKIQGVQYEKGKENASFHADQGFAKNDYENVELVGNVRVSKLSDQKTPSITFDTDQLSGNTKTNQIVTDHEVMITSPQGKFQSQGLKANLNTGEYEFYTIRGLYEPAS